MIILSAFDKFAKFNHNLSLDVIKLVKDHIYNIPIEKIFLPVNWVKSIKIYLYKLKDLKVNPKLVIFTGIQESKKICIEKFAYNWKSGLDNNKKFRIGLIESSGPLRLKTTINLKKLYSSLEMNLPITLSFYPGIYLCNYIYYLALFNAKKKYPIIFIHFPNKGDIKEYGNLIELIITNLFKYQCL